MSLYGKICGHPVKFYHLNRPRTDLFPVCHRPPEHAERDLAAGRPVRHRSQAAMETERKRSRENRWRYGKARHARLAA